jgi:phospholipid/cholesterol/gamma-HCH transport system substrate-binding protein
MDKKLANNVIVGIMVSVGFVAFVFVLFSIGSGGVLQSQYTLYGTFTHVKGLHMGSEVSLAGLRIGVVKKISVANDKNKDLIVELSVNRSAQEYIRKDSIAEIRTAGVLGDKYIEISFGSNDSPILKHGDPITSMEAEDVFAQSGKLVGGLSKKFSEGGDFDSMMRNLSVVTKNLATITTEFRQQKAAEKLGKAVTSLQVIMAKVEKGEGTLGGLITDPTIYEDLKSITGGAKRSAILQYFMKQFISDGKKTTPPPAE